MASAEEYSRFVGMDYASQVATSQKLVLQRDSKIYGHLKSRLATRLAEMRLANDRKKQTGRRKKLVVPYVLEPDVVFKLGSEYSDFDLVFKQTDRTCGALAKTVFQITSEKLFASIRGKWADVVAYGVSLNQIIIQNRHWVHLCMSVESADIAARSVRDDRAMCAILNAARKRGKQMSLTDAYARGDLSRLCCGDATSCKKQAACGIMMLTGVDTNYRQLCAWMIQHGVRLLYFAFPCVKATEMQFDADIPELGARVVHEGDKFHILYKNAVSMGQTYTHKNHLSLIGKVHEQIGKKFFMKEYTGHQNGMSYYKVTMSNQQFDVQDDLYRSWNTAGYQKRYLIQSFELRNNVVDVFDPRSYQPFRFEVDREPIDKLIDYAVGLENGSFDHMAIARRLRGYMTTTVHSGYNMVSGGLKLSEKEFTHVILAVYVHVFQQRFVSGVSLSFVTGQDVDLRYLRDCGALALIPYTLGLLVRTGIVVPVKKFFGWMRKLFDSWFGKRRVALPKIVMPQSFIEYKDAASPSVWDVCKSWLKLDVDPTIGFSPYLPGFPAALAKHGRSVMLRYNLAVQQELRQAVEDCFVTPQLHRISEPVDLQGVTNISELISDAMQESTPVLMHGVEIDRGAIINHPTVNRLVDNVVAAGEGGAVLQRVKMYAPAVFDPGVPFSDAHNGIVEDPYAILSTVMGKIFPQSTLMQTDGVAGEIHYGTMEIVARAVRIKLNASKLAPLRPERIFRPVMPNQMLPNAKQTMQAVLPTVVKRNLNTTSSVDPLDVNEMWDRTWKFMKQVYYVDDVEERLAMMEPIMPNVESVAVWASKLDEGTRERVAETDFRSENVMRAMLESSLMLKGKRKMNLGPSYDSAVKAAQSIQYDPSKSRTAIYSPIFAEKVIRDKSVLRDNVFIMQSKSPDDLNHFLSAFKWNTKGNEDLHYIEMDAEMFDKSQVLTTLMMHWKKCEKFGVLPSYMQLLEEGVTYRSAASIQAGIKVYLTPQRGSGDSDTLDGNCDVSQAAYARFFSTFASQIAFILIMGDDVTVAVRGSVDTTFVEADCMKEFNLSVKLTESKFGYFVSGWLVHMPDGSIKWCTDPIKRAVALGDQSVAETVDLKERHESYRDQCRGLEGLATQSYLADAIAERYGRVLDVKISRSDVIDMIKSVVTVASKFDNYRKFFGSEAFKRQS